MKQRKTLLPLLTLTLMLNAGCASKGPVQMVSHELNYYRQSNLITYDRTRIDTLHLMPMEDKRLSTELNGSSPKAMNVILYASHTGNFVTPDSLWETGNGGRKTAQVLTGLSAGAFKDTGFFKDIKIHDDKTALGGSGIILKTKLKSFYGERYYRKTTTFLLITRRTVRKLYPSKGHCTIAFELIDGETGTPLKSGEVEANIKAKDLTITEAAEEALNQALANLANDVTAKALLD